VGVHLDPLLATSLTLSLPQSPPLRSRQEKILSTTNFVLPKIKNQQQGGPHEISALDFFEFSYLISSFITSKVRDTISLLRAGL